MPTPAGWPRHSASWTGSTVPGGIAQPGDDDRLDPGRVATNFVLFKVDRDQAAFLAALRARNVLMVEYFHGQVRAATHHDVTAADIDDDHRRRARGPRRDPLDAAGGRRHDLTQPRAADRRQRPRPAPASGGPRRPFTTVTDTVETYRLPRPEPVAGRGPGDDAFYDLVETRFRRLVASNPVLGTYLGLHAHDGDLGDGGREAILADLAADRVHLATIEAIDPATLSAAVRFERDLELHNVRREIFDTDVLRIWERRSLALDLIGDGLFLLFARDHAPLAERLEAISGRLEAVPGLPRCGPDARRRTRRSACGRASSWRPRRELPAFLAEIAAAADPVLAAAERRRLERAIAAANVAVELYDDLAGGHPRRRHGRLADRSRAPRRPGRPSRLRRPGRRRHPRPRLGEAGGGTGGPDRGGPRGRPGRHRGRGHRSHQVRPPGRLRRRPGRLSRRDAARPPAPHRPRPRVDPGRRADRGHRHARLPAQRRCRSRRTSRRRPSSATPRASTSRRRRSTATRTRCASTTSRPSATPASTRPTPATTSSSTWPAAIRR